MYYNHVMIIKYKIPCCKKKLQNSMYLIMMSFDCLQIQSNDFLHGICT